MKTVEELLVQRYKVIADYPQSALKVGDIISFELQHVEIAKYTALNGDPIKLAVMEKTVQKYPHLFQPLEWHEELKECDLPEYLAYQKESHYPKGTVVKVDKWAWEWRGKRWWFRDHSQPPVNLCTRYAGDYLPATIEEYEAFKQQKEG